MKKFYLLLIALLSALPFLKAQHCFTPEGTLPVSRGVQTISSAAHIARETEYDVKFYFLDLDIERTNTVISGNVLVRAQVVATTMDTFAIELDPVFTIDSVRTNVSNNGFQSAVVKRGTGTDVNILLAERAHANEDIEVRIYYHGTAAKSTGGNPNGAGFFVSNSSANVFSASPPYNSSTWWPCKQNLTDKADSSWFFITTDTSNTAISNGSLSRTVSVSNTKKRWEYKSRYPIDFYLICFTVGKFSKRTEYFKPIGRTDSMVVEYYGITDTATTKFTPRVLQKYSELFGLYPFYEEKFALALVTLGGGIENQTFVSYGATPNVIEHETMHQWFGDNVTCASYRDVWLNEGFARWAESLYTELTSVNPNNSRISFCTQYESGSIYSLLGALGYPSGSIYNSNVDTVGFAALYGGLGRAMNYEKPAMMINMLRFEVGNDSLFFRCLRNYQDQYHGKTATGNDFWDVVENTTGRDFSDFFNQWYLGYGHPIFNIKWKQVEDSLLFQVTETTSSANTPLFKVQLQLTVKQRSGGIAADTLITVPINQNVSGFRMFTQDSVTGFVVDPNQWLLNKAGTITKDPNLEVVITGMDEVVDNNKFIIYPNPTTGSINIRSSLQAYEWIEAELFNSLGQRVQVEKFYTGDQLKLNTLPEGIYILRINQSYTYKVSLVH